MFETFMFMILLKLFRYVSRKVIRGSKKFSCPLRQESQGLQRKDVVKIVLLTSAIFLHRVSGHLYLLGRENEYFFSVILH